MSRFNLHRKKRTRQIALPFNQGLAAEAMRGYDTVLLIAVSVLLGMGIIMVFSSGALVAWERYGDSLLFLKKKIYFTLLGLGLMVFLMRLDYKRLLYLTLPLMVLSMALLVVIFIPGVGIEAGGARRWISLGGMTFQPSELTKLALIFYFSHILTKKRERLNDFYQGYLPMLLVLGLFCMLIILQPDLGTAALIGVIIYIMFFVGGVPLSFTLGTLLASTPLLYFTITGADYRMRRILAFLKPWDDPLNAGFQTTQSFMALGRGGLFGLGLGSGKQKLFYLPEPHSDFIFSVIGEELGLVGTLTIASLFVIIVWRGVRAATRCQDLQGTLLAFGISALFGIQALMHMAVATGLMPAKGLTLPFISAGGSSLMMSMAAMGVLLNIARRSNHG